MRKQLVSGKKLLLFVDTGDNCRCPLAIGYLSKLLAQKGIDYIDLRHMGVMTPNDLLPTPEVVQLLKEEGVDIRYHRSRPVNDDLIRAADLVLGFTAIHVQTCLRRVPESKGKVFLLKQYVGLAHTGDQIHDPMGSTMEIFKKYFSDIKTSLHKLMEMEFITTPPEPKEVVIAPSVSKPRTLADAEEEEPAHRRSRRHEAETDEQEPAAKKSKPAAEKAEVKETAPRKKAAGAAKPRESAAAGKEPATKKATAKAPSTSAGKSAKAKPEAKTKPTAAKAAPAKATKAPAAKPAKAAAKPAKSAPATKKAAAGKSGTAIKSAKSAVAPAKKAAVSGKAAAGKAAAKTKSKK